MIVLKLLWWLNFPSLRLASFEKLNDHYIRKQVKCHRDSAKVVISPNPFYKGAFNFRCGLGRKKERKREREKPGLSGEGAWSRERRKTMSFTHMPGFVWKILNPKMPKHRPMPKNKEIKNRTDSALSQSSQQIIWGTPCISKPFWHSLRSHFQCLCSSLTLPFDPNHLKHP